MVERDARRALLGRLIDHAPTFPPALLPPAEAVAEDARAQSSTHSFVLARLVWPASQLDALGGLDRELSIVLDDALPAETQPESVEVRFRDDLGGLASLAGEIYVEVPLDDDLGEHLDAVAAHGLRAKVRCGGDSTPDLERLADFVRACRARDLVFKATAGLHHAVRSNGEHGFLNLLAAVVFGHEEDALAESDAEAFSLTPDAFGWRDRSADVTELEDARRNRFHSIGSCSFFEPIEELETLGLLA